MKTIRIAIQIILSLIFMFALTLPVYAERYALLIGVSEYDDPTFNLKGPINDVNSLQQILIHRWGFLEKNLIVLKNKQAQVENVVNSLQKLSEKLTKDDYLLFFFSGHGSSPYDPCNNQQIPHDSGALVMHNVKNGQGLLLTKTDLKPYLVKMDNNGVHGLGLIDACYSGNSYRGNGDFKYRYARIPTLKSNQLPGCHATEPLSNNQTEILSYPYKNFVFMLASSAHEKALELDNGLERYSFDGLVHGAFSNALIEALKHKKNHSHESLFMQIEQKMAAIPNMNHSPLLSPDMDQSYEKDAQYFPAQRLYQNAIFSHTKLASAGAENQSAQLYSSTSEQLEPILINIPKQYGQLRKVVRDTIGLQLNNHSLSQLVDFLVTINKTSPGQLILTDVHNVPVYTTESANEKQSIIQMARVLRQQYWLRQLRESVNHRQPFAVRITTKQADQTKHLDKLPKKCLSALSKQLSKSVNPKYSNETFAECDILNLRVKPERKAYLVVLDLTSDGEFSLIYPYADGDHQPITPENPFQSDMLLSAPFGMESIIAFAFQSADDPLYQKIQEKWQNQKDSLIRPGDSLHAHIVKRFMTNHKRHAQHIKNFLLVKKVKH